MKTKVYYVYRSFGLGCGCCSDSESYVEVTEPGKYAVEQQFPYCETEEEVRAAMSTQFSDITDYEVDPDSQYF